MSWLLRQMLAFSNKDKYLDKYWLFQTRSPPLFLFVAFLAVVFYFI